MNDRAKQKLVQVVDEETLSVLDEPERLEGLLRDYCGDCRREISALIAALQEDVPADLSRGGSEPYPILTARLAGKLHEERNIIPEAAQWAVESWAVALEIAPGSKRHAGGPAATGGGMGGQAPQGVTGGGGGFPGQVPTPGPGPAQWTMPPIPDANLQKTPLPAIDGGWPQTLPGQGPGPAPGPGGVPRKISEPPWQPPVVAPQPWQAANAAAPPAHNSILAAAICFGVAVATVYSINYFGMAGPQQVVMVFAAMAGGIELLLAGVRFLLKRQRPPAFVLSSMSFWMTLFTAEDIALRIFSRKNKAQAQAAPAAFPTPVPQAGQAYGQPSVQSANPAQTPVGAPSGGEGVFCISCGKTNVKGANSCAFCGEKLYYPEAQAGAAPN